MVKAWYIDDNNEQRSELLTLDNLYMKTGVEYFKLNVDTYATDGVLGNLKKERGYNYEDEMVCSRQGLASDEEKMKAFWSEHLHADEEIRFFLEGSGYFDVRDANDHWIRIEVCPGDMIIVPSGIYHRFMINSEVVKVKRIFTEVPAWRAYNRPADDLEARMDYVEKLQKGYFVVQTC